MSKPFRTKFHRDGSATVWNVYTQQWERTSCVQLVRAARSANAILPTLPERERRRIIRAAERKPVGAD